MNTSKITPSVLKKSRPPHSSISLIPVLLLCFLLAHDQASSQTSSNDWTNVLRLLQDRRDSINNVKAEYLVEYMQSPELDEEYDRVSAEAFEHAKANGDVPSNATKPHEIYNRVATIRLQRKGLLWREDISEAYPGNAEGKLLNHFRGFDGERYYVYDAQRSLGLVAATEADMQSATTRFGNVSNGSQFLDQSLAIKILESFKDSKLSFSVVGNENINGEKCVKYIATSQSQMNFLSRFTIWVSPGKRYSLVKWKSEVFGKSSKSSTWGATVIVGNILAFEKMSNEFYVNKLYQEDTFSTKSDGKLHWEFSKRFTLSDIQIREKVASTTFLAQFPPGTLISDKILSPGRLTVVGANPLPAAENMRNGIKIKLEPLENTPSPQPQPGEVFPEPTVSVK